MLNIIPLQKLSQTKRLYKSIRYSQTAVKAVCFKTYTQGHLNCDRWKKFHNYINFSDWTVTIIHRKINHWVNEKKNYKFPLIIFLNSNENSSSWLRLTWICHRFTRVETPLLSLATVFFPHSPIPTPLPLAASAGSTSSTPASPFLLLVFQCGQVCGVGILTIDSRGLVPAGLSQHPGSNQLPTFPAVLWICVLLFWELHCPCWGWPGWLHAETGPNVIPQLLVPMHCPTSLLAHHIQGAGLSGDGPYPAGFPIASAEVLQGIQPAFYGPNTLNFDWRKKQSRWCPDWEQLTFDVFWKHSLAKGH